MKNILTTVAGSTPQILTETLYDFIVQRSLMINELVIITTKYGKSVFEQQLFENKDGRLGKFYQFCAEYDVPAHSVSITFVVIENEAGEQLSDIRSAEDNRAAANCIVKTIRRYTQNDEHRILASLAGGRKTMSAYMGYAMQLYARRHDQLFHVLVAPETLESNPFFFYPPKNKQDFSFKNRKGEIITVPHDQIKITNAEIPFIRLRETSPLIHGPEAMEYEDLVILTQNEISQAFAPIVKIEPKNATVIVKWREHTWEIKLKPADFAFYWYLLKKRSIVNSKGDAHAKGIAKLYYKVRPDVDKEDFSALPAFDHIGLIDSRSRINRNIEEAIPFDKIHHYICIQSRQENRIPTYFIDLPEKSADDYLNII